MQRHTDSQAGELSERSQARWDGAFQIVVIEIPIGPGGQGVGVGAVENR
jgi:hypothetical protein